MSLQPLEIQKTRFDRKLRGYDPQEVENFLSLVAEDLTQRVAEIDRLEKENQRLRERFAIVEERERQLQEAILRGKKVSDEIIATSQREAQLLVKEAEMTADKIVTQAMERAGDVEARIQELRARRKELQIKMRGTLELFGQILEADFDDERTAATVHTLAPRRTTS
ncbi:MAG: DivIVA domain-containing protein [Thermoanaerobaculia bacterium]|jgi:cell division initiation protein